MDSGLLYANARIKSLENNLLSSDKLIRMVESKNLEEALKVLVESNYGGGVVLDNPNNFEELLQNEEKNLINFIREIMPKGTGLEIFLLKLDYHNAKALMKAKYSRIENPEFMMFESGTIDNEKLKDNIMTDNYSSFYEDMADAMKEIDLAFVNGDRNPRIIDNYLDKAFFNHIAQISKNIKSIMKSYIVALADLTNFSLLMRFRKAKLDVKEFEKSFVNGGKLDLSFFTKLFDQTNEVILEKFKFTDYKDLVNIAINKSLVDFETNVDNYFLNIFKDAKHDMFGISPMAGYYIAKSTEIKVARMVLVCLKNKVDKKLIKQRLRELYA